MEVTEELVQIPKAQLDELRRQNKEMKEDISLLKSFLFLLENKYGLFSVLARLKGGITLAAGNSIIQLLRKVSRDPKKEEVFSGITNLAQKYSKEA